MDSHSCNCLLGRGSFGFSSYMDTNYFARHNNRIRFGSRSLSEDSTLKFRKMEMENKLDQPCQFLSSNNLASQLEGCSKRNDIDNSCQIKSNKQISPLQQDHLNIMPISSTFLIGGYVGSKSQKENAHRTRINVQIQDFIFNKLFDLMGNAVKSVTKCSKNLDKSANYSLNMTITDEGKNSGLTGLSKSITEIITENNHISQIVDQSSIMNCHGKQSYADVTKTSVLSLNKLMGLKIENKHEKAKLVTQSKFNQFPSSKINLNASMTKQSIKIDHKSIPKPTVDVTLRHNMKNSENKCKDFETLNKRNSRKNQCRPNSEGKNKIVRPKCELSGRDVFSQYEMSKEPNRERSNNKIMQLTEEDFSEISLPIPEKTIDLASNNIKQKVSNYDQSNMKGTDVTIQFHGKTPPIDNPKVSNPMLIGLSSKNYCDLALGNKASNYTPIQVTLKQDQLDQNRKRATSECSIDSEDSFIVFTNECDDHGNSMYIEETDDTFWSDDSFSDDGFCVKGCSSWTQIDKFGHCSNSEKEKTKPKKKVKFADEKELVKVHRMVAWDYALRMARIGPWETCARDSARFKHRICQIGTILNRILDPHHRQRIYSERFSS